MYFKILKKTVTQLKPIVDQELNMVTSEERMKVLKMIEDGRISVEDGAKLMSALEDRQPAGRRPVSHGSGLRDPRMLHVRVTDSYGSRKKVNVVLPLSLVDAGLSIASNFIEGTTNEHAVALAEAIRAGKTGMVIDYLDDSGGEHVQVFIE